MNSVFSHTNAFIEFCVGNAPTLMDIIRTSPLRCVGVVIIKNVDDDIVHFLLFRKTYMRNFFLISEISFSFQVTVP